MAQINVSNLTFCYDGSFDNIFENVSFSIDTNWKLGFIGRNGRGKTTFLNLLMGKYEYQGTISTSTVFDYFPYQITDQQMKKCCGNFLDEIRPGCEFWRVICELDKLHLEADILYRPFETLSYGERTKVMLAILFFGGKLFPAHRRAHQSSGSGIQGNCQRISAAEKKDLSLYLMTGICWMHVWIMYWH